MFVGERERDWDLLGSAGGESHECDTVEALEEYMLLSNWSGQYTANGGHCVIWQQQDSTKESVWA
jgi:hypothetical protein